MCRQVEAWWGSTNIGRFRKVKAWPCGHVAISKLICFLRGDHVCGHRGFPMDPIQSLQKKNIFLLLEMRLLGLTQKVCYLLPNAYCGPNKMLLPILLRIGNF